MHPSRLEGGRGYLCSGCIGGDSCRLQDGESRGFPEHAHEEGDLGGEEASGGEVPGVAAGVSQQGHGVVREEELSTYYVLTTQTATEYDV